MLNNNKIVWGVTMILLNMGSKYVLADLGNVHEKLFANEVFKKIILFSMFFVATRDLIISFLLTIVYTLVIDGIFHEKRNFSIVGGARGSSGDSVMPGITQKQYEDAKAIVKKYEEQGGMDGVKQQEDIYDNYLKNIQTINYI